jgi:hypothetical protein
VRGNEEGVKTHRFLFNSALGVGGSTDGGVWCGGDREGWWWHCRLEVEDDPGGPKLERGGWELGRLQREIKRAKTRSEPKREWAVENSF